MKKLSVQEYAKLLGVTRQAILLQIKEKRLAKGVTCKKIGNTYSLTVQYHKENKEAWCLLFFIEDISSFLIQAK